MTRQTIIIIILITQVSLLCDERKTVVCRDSVNPSYPDVLPAASTETVSTEGKVPIKTVCSCFKMKITRKKKNKNRKRSSVCQIIRFIREQVTA